VKRHALSTRLWHWINAVSVIVLFMSGLNISNAHRRLYWGAEGFAPSEAWLFVIKFPGWATIPGYYSLAIARDWHVVFSLVFAFSLLLFMVVAIANGHIRRDLRTRLQEWQPTAVWADIRAHLHFDFHREGSKYNFLQRASYGLVLFILLPLMIFTGMAMSPGLEGAWPWMADLFGGRQSARSIHFLCAFGLLAFFIIHVLLVLASGPIRQLRDMIGGGREP